jgi:hypothetical protein
MRAPLPNIGFTCPHCKVALKYVPVQWGFICLLLFLSLPFLFVLGIALKSLMGVTTQWVVLYLALVLVLWVPFEFAIARRHRAQSQLYLRGAAGRQGS